MRLKDRVAIVTGAAQGIGRAYAERFLAEGASVAVADLNEELGREVVESMVAGGGDAIFVPVNIAAEESVEAAAATVADHYGRIDVLVNNAALYGGMDTRDQSLAYLEKMFSINLHGTWLMCRAVVPTMVEQGGGRIINQSSGAAYTYVIPVGKPEFRGVGSFAYSQTKWGVIGLTKFLAGQLGKHNVTVNCISPGIVDTEGTRSVVREEWFEMAKYASAMQRVLQPEDMTGAAVFFASDDAALVTGQVLSVDGGAHMPA